MRNIWKFITNLLLTVFVVVWFGLRLIIGTFVHNPWKKMQ